MRSLFACLVLLLSSSVSAQKLDGDSITYCVERARTALDVAKSIAEGLPPDKINLAFFHAPKNDDDMAYRDKWAQDLKEEVAQNYAALPEGPNRALLAAQKVAETCAYEHGKKRRMKQVASSEAIRGDTKRRNECREILIDHIYIGQSIGRMMPREELEHRAKVNAPRLGQERVEKIMGLIEEAYASKDIQAWFDRHLADCMKGVGT